MTNSLQIRDEMRQAHARLLDHFAAPGDSWGATERVAMVAEVRRARAADELPPWVAPSTVDGLIDRDHPLGPTAVDAIWRIANHPGSLTKAWYDEITDGRLEPAAYVELVAVVAMAVALDDFQRAVGLPAPALPAPSAESARGRASDGIVDSHWVPTQPDVQPNVRKALSIAPAECELQGVVLDAQYVPGGALAVDLGENIWSLTRTQLELVASRVSSANECFY